MVVGSSEGSQTLFEGQIIMGFFIWGAAGSLHGKLVMWARATKTVLGTKEPGIFRRSTSAALGFNHGQCLDIPGSWQGTVL